MKPSLLAGRVADGGGDPGTAGAIWHLDFSNASSYTESGGTITAAIDLTGTQANLVPGSGPALTSAAYNGLDCARFNGTSQYLTSLSPFMQAAHAASVDDTLTVIAVVRARSLQTDAYWLVEGDGGTNDIFGFNCDDDDAAFFSRGGGSAALRWQDESNGAFENASGNVHVHSYEIGAGGGSLWLDGGAGEDVVAGTTQAPTVDRIALGALRRNTVSLYMAIDICEIRMWDVILADADREAQEDYLASKWGV